MELGNSVRGSIRELVFNSLYSSVWILLNETIKYPPWRSIENSVRASIGRLVRNLEHLK